MSLQDNLRESISFDGPISITNETINILRSLPDDIWKSGYTFSEDDFPIVMDYPDFTYDIIRRNSHVIAEMWLRDKVDVISIGTKIPIDTAEDPEEFGGYFDIKFFLGNRDMPDY